MNDYDECGTLSRYYKEAIERVLLGRGDFDDALNSFFKEVDDRKFEEIMKKLDRIDWEQALRDAVESYLRMCRDVHKKELSEHISISIQH